MTTRRGRDAHGPDEPANLSEEDVERRLEGGAGFRVMHVRPQATSTREQVARDTGIILAGALLAIAAGQALGGGLGTPGDSGEVMPTEIVTRSEAPLDSLVAIATLPPPATIGPIVNPSLDIGASPTPVPFETLGPTSVTYVVKVRNDDGGNDTASDWQLSISGAHPSVSSFSGSADGRKVQVDPLKSFDLTISAATPDGYSQSRDGNCDGPVPKGLSVTCTITENDKPVKLTVFVRLHGGTGKVSSVTVRVKQGGTTQKFSGSNTGKTVSLLSNKSWTTTASDLPEYAAPTFSSACSRSGAREGASYDCIVSYLFIGTQSPSPSAPFGPLLPLLPLRRRHLRLR